MNRKIGKFKLWQLLAVGGALGLIIYEYEKGKPETREGSTLAAAENPFAGVGGGGSGSGGSNEPVQPVTFPGEPGPAGPEGTPGPAGAEQTFLTPQMASEVSAIAEGLNSGLPGASRKPAPMSGKFPQTNPRTGQKYKTVKEHGKTIHVYANGHRVTVGGRKKHPEHHPNPHHHRSHAAPRAPIHHNRPKPLKPKPHPKPPPRKHKAGFR